MSATAPGIVIDTNLKVRADASDISRGHRRILRDGCADAGAWRDRLGERSHGAGADADRHGHGSRRFPAIERSERPTGGLGKPTAPLVGGF